MVVIGSADVSDLKTVLEDQVYGYQVHARYIAALLGGAYLREWPLLIQLALVAMLLGVTEFITLTFDIDGHLPARWFSPVVRRFPFLLKKGRGPSVMLVVTMLCLLVWLAAVVLFYATWLPPHIGYLPPLGLLATSVLLLLNDLRLYGVTVRNKARAFGKREIQGGQR